MILFLSQLWSYVLHILYPSPDLMFIFPTKPYLSFGALKIFLHIKQRRVNRTSFSNTSSVSDGNSCIKPKSSNWQLTDWHKQDQHPDILPDRQLTDFSQPAWPQVSITNTIAGVHLILSKCRFLLIFSFNFHMLAETDGTGFSCNYYESRITNLKSAPERKGTIQICKHRVTALDIKIQKYDLTYRIARSSSWFID